MTNEDQSGLSNLQLTRRQAFIAAAVAAGAMTVGDLTWRPSAANAAVLSQAEHAAIPIFWVHPHNPRARRGKGVDGYPQPSYPGHKGVDYYTTPPYGQPIYAAADGTVTVSDYAPSALGQYLTIDHGQGVYADYGHMITGSKRVNQGQYVTAGTLLGLTGYTGYLLPPEQDNAHLHIRI